MPAKTGIFRYFRYVVSSSFSKRVNLSTRSKEYRELYVNERHIRPSALFGM